MKVEKITIAARDGFPLSATLFQPKDKSQGVIQLHTGTGIPQKLYANLASFLAEQGFTALTFDYRGVAESAPDSLKNFSAEVIDWGRKDMTGVFDWVMDNYPDQKKTIIAHSMGGQMIGLMDNHASIDQLYFIASSTGYWGDMSFPFKWQHIFFWYFLIPLHVRMYGYVNAMKVRQGENLPAGVAMQWRKWCTNSNYFEPDYHGGALAPHFFEQVTTPIESIRISDDPIANGVTVKKMLGYYKNAPIQERTIHPSDYGLHKIGHTGFFSRKMKKLWEQVVTEIAS